MKMNSSYLRRWPVYSALGTFFCLAPFASAQQATPADNDRSVQDRDKSRDERASFNEFLNSHNEVAEQLRKDPSLANNDKFVKKHPALRDYLKDHPAVRNDLRNDAAGYMRQEDRSVRDNGMNRDRNREELARFNRFLDDHREAGEQLRRNPSLVNDRQFMNSHPEVQAYVQQHPGVRDAVRDDPDALRNDYSRRDNDANRTGADRDRRDNDADRNRTDADRDRDANSKNANSKDANSKNDADRDRRDNDADRAKSNDTDHDRDANRSNNDADRDRRDNDADRGRSSNRQARASFDQFLDNHRETAEQLRRDPSLANNQQFLKNHPELQSYLQSHPQVQRDLSNNPNAFMREESRYDNQTAANRGDRDQFASNRNPSDRDRNNFNANSNERSAINRDRDMGQSHAQSFGAFLGSHSEISEQLSSNPGLVKDRDYMKNHPELQSYLNDHPEVQHELMANPQTFVKSAQQFSTKTGTGTTTGTTGGMKASPSASPTTTTSPTTETKPATPKP